MERASQAFQTTMLFPMAGSATETKKMLLQQNVVSQTKGQTK
jgi:hypothetical protein